MQYVGSQSTYGQLGGAFSEDGEDWTVYNNLNYNGNPPWGGGGVGPTSAAQARNPSALLAKIIHMQCGMNIQITMILILLLVEGLSIHMICLIGMVVDLSPRMTLMLKWGQDLKDFGTDRLIAITIQTPMNLQI